MKIGRNRPCPCCSGKKYKDCCLGKHDWGNISSKPDIIRHLSIRGKNIAFLKSVSAILGLDSSNSQIDWPKLKKDITVEHVFLVHELLGQLWLDGADLHQKLTETEDLSGLYSGDYTPEAITSSLTRHALYSESLMLFDPMLFPGSLKPEYDPLIHPEKYISHTIKCLYFWFSLSPWIFEGILKIIRSPSDFDLTLGYESIKAEEARIQKHPELQQKMKQLTEETDLNHGEFGWFSDYMRLAVPDEKIKGILKSKKLSDKEITSFMKYRARKKEDHPYYTERRHNEIFVTKRGECFGVEKMVANLSGAFLVTDNDFKWSMIRIERQNEQIDESAWEPFANAVAKAPLKYISNITLEDCLRLRKDGLLLRMRSFMRRVWANSRIADDFSASNAQQFAAELDQEIANAEKEWSKINSNLRKWFAAESVAAFAAIPQIDLANVGWLAASLGVAGAAHLAEAKIKRKSLKKQMPGAFFLSIKHK